VLIFLKIRFLQAFRIIKEIGAVRMLLFVVCFLPFLLRYFAEAWYLGTVSVLFMVLLHLARTDKKFLQILQITPQKVYALDYGLFLLPSFTFLLYIGAYWHFLACLVLVLGFMFVPFTLPQYNQPLFLFTSRWIPARAFEWKSGFRQYFSFVFVCLLLGFGLSKYEVTIPLVIIFFTLLTTCFYLEFEPLEMLLVFGKTPQKLLLSKIKGQLFLFWIFMLPLVLLFLVFHAKYWYLMPYFLLSSSLAQIFAILYKYAVYQPATNSQLNVFIYVLFGSAFLFIVVIPLFVPVGIFILVRYYRKAVKNLAFWLS
jgi:hypothetical protein